MHLNNLGHAPICWVSVTHFIFREATFFSKPRQRKSERSLIISHHFLCLSPVDLEFYFFQHWFPNEVESSHKFTVSAQIHSKLQNLVPMQPKTCQSFPTFWQFQDWSKSQLQEAEQALSVQDLRCVVINHVMCSSFSQRNFRRTLQPYEIINGRKTSPRAFDARTPQRLPSHTPSPWQLEVRMRKFTARLFLCKVPML